MGSRGEDFAELAIHRVLGDSRATARGSVDAALLVNNWNSITFQPTATTLHRA
jgi:hypothetical protein